MAGSTVVAVVAAAAMVEKIIEIVPKIAKSWSDSTNAARAKRLLEAETELERILHVRKDTSFDLVCDKLERAWHGRTYTSFELNSEPPNSVCLKCNTCSKDVELTKYFDGYWSPRVNEKAVMEHLSQHLKEHTWETFLRSFVPFADAIYVVALASCLVGCFIAFIEGVRRQSILQEAIVS
jgi:hypothetical protein